MDTKMMINQIPDETILTRQDILQIACEVDVSFRETLLRNLLENLLQEGILVRAGRGRYQKFSYEAKKATYLNQYSKEAKNIVEEMNDKFPLMDYRIWEINWLNEF